jgi:hypothetical protein
MSAIRKARRERQAANIPSNVVTDSETGNIIYLNDVVDDVENDFNI